MIFQEVSVSDTSHECAALNFDGALNFESIPCTGSLLTPMCIRPTSSSQPVRFETSKKKRTKSEKARKGSNSSKKKLKWRQKKNRGRKMIGYNKRSVETKDRQLTGGNFSVDVCLVSIFKSLRMCEHFYIFRYPLLLLSSLVHFSLQVSLH